MFKAVGLRVQFISIPIQASLLGSELGFGQSSGAPREVAFLACQFVRLYTSSCHDVPPQRHRM